MQVLQATQVMAPRRLRAILARGLQYHDTIVHVICSIEAKNKAKTKHIFIQVSALISNFKSFYHLDYTLHTATYTE